MDLCVAYTKHTVVVCDMTECVCLMVCFWFYLNCWQTYSYDDDNDVFLCV